MTARKTDPGPELHTVQLVTQPHRGDVEVTSAELRDLLLQGLVKPTKDQQEAAAAVLNPTPTGDAGDVKKES